MGQFRFLHIFRPFLPIVPEVPAPDRRIHFREKALWTAVTLLIFLICSQVPLYGIMNSQGADPMYWFRAIMASSRGTLMDIGIQPFVTASMFMSMLSNAGFIVVDNAVKEDRILFNAAQKILALVITLGLATVQIVNGVYGDPSSLGAGICLLLCAQIFMAGVIIMLLDELLQRGYGLSSGISIFIATNICDNIIWKSFSPTTYNTGRGTEFEGAVIAFFHLILTRGNKFRAIYEAFFRQNLPNLSNLIATLGMFLLVIYLQGFRIELPIQSRRVRGQTGTYPIKLFYTSSTPIMLQSNLVSFVFTGSQLLYNKFPRNFLVRLLGVWEAKEGNSHLSAISGISYLLSAPDSVWEALKNPIHFVLYLAIIMGTSAAISNMWIEVSGTAPKDVARQLRDQQMTIRGHRDESTQKELSRIIPMAACVGGLTLAGLSVLTDLVGAFGSGTGILLAVTTIYQYFEMMAKEQAEQPSDILSF